MVTPLTQEGHAEIPAHISRHLLGASNEFCNTWLTQGSRMYSDIITAHSAVHERGQPASIQPQKAELQNSFFHVEAEEVTVSQWKSQPSTKNFNCNKWGNREVSVYVLARKWGGKKGILGRSEKRPLVWCTAFRHFLRSMFSQAENDRSTEWHQS